MKSDEIRKKFLDFFNKKDHALLPSSPVIPHNDPTLLFVNAGMNQFKDIFLGKQPSPWPTATSCQKCIRVGGKHNDLENVGHTSRHLTFFEMLGNFSFGEYFKEGAIDKAFEFVRDYLKLDISRLWATVLHNDDHSFQLWKRYLPEERICRMSEKDNFWAMGETGPCGPCTELLYDRGPEFGEARTPAEDVTGERFFEFWNLVFMESNRDATGKMTPLPKQCVDTGAGLERLVLLTENKRSLFETDILYSIIEKVGHLVGRPYDPRDLERAPAFHVIADHLRSLVFAISDGVEPSNLDRGYILRKIVRRACRYGRTLGLDKPFLGELSPYLIELMKECYPELGPASTKVKEILLKEEENFLRTLKRGGALLSDVIARAKKSGSQIRGEDAFMLKDTYGLPLEEILLLAKDGALTVDVARFETLEHEAKERSKAAHKKEAQVVESSIFAHFVATKGASRFLGYEQFTCEATIIGLLKEGKEVLALYEGEEGYILLDQTPFYAEMGGQVGDQGVIASQNAACRVLDCTLPYPEALLHSVCVTQGTLTLGDQVTATVDEERRRAIQNNHTATHLLHWALKVVLGAHVGQAGSIVDPLRLRFDFRHHKALTTEEITQIEDLVNERILQNHKVTTYEKLYEEIRGRPEFQQMFGEKYGKTVRIIDIDFSKELCGGTHTPFTGTIGQFRIAKETSIATGVRRIEAVTGAQALAMARSSEQLLRDLTSLVKAQAGRLEEKIRALLEEQKELTQEIKSFKQAGLAKEAQALLLQIEEIKGVRTIAAEVTHPPKELSDLIMQQSEPLFLILVQKQEEKLSFFLRVSKVYTKQGLTAIALLKQLTEWYEVRGGGKEELAQGSCPKVDIILQSLKRSKVWIELGVTHS